MRALGKLGAVQPRRRPAPAALGTFGVGPQSYGVQPGSFSRRIGEGSTPALTGLFQDGAIRTGISQINTMATNVLRGGGG